MSIGILTIYRDIINTIDNSDNRDYTSEKGVKKMTSKKVKFISFFQRQVCDHRNAQGKLKRMPNGRCWFCNALIDEKGNEVVEISVNANLIRLIKKIRSIFK